MRRALVCTLLVATAGTAAAQAEDQAVCAPPRIASIELSRHEIFVENEDTPGIYKFINKLHFNTKEHVIRRELLFAVGGVVDPEAMAQSERNLRATRFLAEVGIEVRPVEGGDVVEAAQLFDPEVICDLGDGEVDVVVTTRDAWTTSVDGSIGSAGGTTTWSVGAEEGNLLGLGKRVRLQHSTEIDRSYNTIAFHDPRVLGSRNELLLEGSDQSDGGRFRLYAGRPWYAIDSTWSWAATLDTFDQIDPLYEAGERVEELHHVRRHQAIGAGFALARNDTQALRLHLGLRHTYDDVQVEVRDFNIAEVGVSFSRHRFLKLNYLNHERPEDVPLGPEVLVKVGYGDARARSDSSNAMFFELGGRIGTQLGARRFTAVSASWAGRVESGAARNAILDVRAGVADGSLLRRSLFLVRGWLRYGVNLDPEVQIRLGADNGLRGYPVNQFVGDRSLLLTAEYRRFLFDNVLRLVSIGVSAFVDSGHAWRPDEPMSIGDLRTNAGVGLLVGRRGMSTRGASMRFDVSYAFDPITGRSPWLASLGLITDLGF